MKQPLYLIPYAMLVKYLSVFLLLLLPYTAPLFAQATAANPIAIDFGLILDVSGSMDSPSCNICQNGRLTELVTATERLVRNLHDLSQALPKQGEQHRLSITVFGAETAGFRDGTLVDIESNFDEIIKYLNVEVYQQVDRQSTSLGGGLFRGIDALSKSARPRNVILLTDGEQSQAPFVRERAGGDFVIETEKQQQLIELNEKLNINFYAVGIGLSPKMEQLLRELSEALAPKQKENDRAPILIPTFADRNLINLALQTQLQRSMSDLGSPQTVDYRWGTLHSNVATEDFLINEYVDEVAFYLIFDGGVGDDWDLLIQQGEQVYTRTDGGAAWRYESGRGYQRFVFRPRRGTASPPNLAGTWTMQITGTTNQDYQAYAVVDDHLTSYNSGVSPSPAYAGDELTLSVELFNTGTPISDATVTAYITEPGESIGSLLAESDAAGDTDFRKINFRNSRSDISRNKNFRYNERWRFYEYFLPEAEATNTFSNVLQERNVSPVDEKIARLRLDFDFLGHLRTNERTIELEEVRPGRYQGRYQTDKAGTHAIIYRIQAQSPTLGGDYHRFIMSTLPLQLGEPDPTESSSSIFVFPYVDPSIFYIRPVDSLKNFLGPGRGDDILVEFPEDNGLAPQSHIQGDMKGGYLVQIHGLPNRSQPNVSLRLAGHDKPFFSGSLRNVFHPWGLIANIGAAIPIGDFAAPVDAGLLAEVGGKYSFGPALGVSLRASYYGFNPNDHLGGFTGNLSYDLLAGNRAVSIITSAGGGYYFAKGGESDFGLNVNLGIERTIRPFLISKLDVGYFNNSVLGATFLTISLGVEKHL